MRKRTTPPKARPNPLIAAGIEYIDYKDTDLLRRFVSDRGKILPQPSAGRGPHRRVTRLTVQQQRAMARAIRNAREMALLPYASGTTR
ncbi:30S ribosomal protein S18 [Streptomyces sp. CBMA123]|uniref:30S ribosomal protein S18 n=1 Tax=Streptomyces sp. CBMA123 TaxID=1896313 RepID=UPI0016620683|nr:30S ribosomal protein S18 [Streptomyces sp. CBMA123]MBD0695923.1 30S ribosomal protein S18 [Streptomyces sp. CBMA123]